VARHDTTDHIMGVHFLKLSKLIVTLQASITPVGNLLPIIAFSLHQDTPIKTRLKRKGLKDSGLTKRDPMRVIV